MRGPTLAAGMSHYLVQEIQATANVDVRLATTIVGGGGDGRLRRLVLRDGATGDEQTVAADALFVLIGDPPALRVDAEATSEWNGAAHEADRR